LQSKCHLWGSHRAGRITASNFNLSTSSAKSALSLVKKLCYPEVSKFSSASTTWGCEHKSDAIQHFLDSFTVEHVAIEFSRYGLTVNVAYPLLGASPDGPWQNASRSLTDAVANVCKKLLPMQRSSDYGGKLRGC